MRARQLPALCTLALSIPEPRQVPLLSCCPAPASLRHTAHAGRSPSPPTAGWQQPCEHPWSHHLPVGCRVVPGAAATALGAADSPGDRRPGRKKRHRLEDTGQSQRDTQRESQARMRSGYLDYRALGSPGSLRPAVPRWQEHQDPPGHTVTADTC